MEEVDEDLFAELEEQLFDGAEETARSYLPTKAAPPVAVGKGVGGAVGDVTGGGDGEACRPPVLVVPKSSPAATERRQSSGGVALDHKVLSDWHKATAALDHALCRRRLQAKVGRLPAASRSERENALQLEAARTHDEIDGTHRRQQQREERAAMMVMKELQETRHYASAVQEISALGAALGMTLGLGEKRQRRDLSEWKRRRAKAGLDTQSPICYLFAGLQPQETKCAVDGAAQSRVLELTNRAERVDFLSTYMQCVLRVPPARMTPRAFEYWQRSGSGISSHSLGPVAGTFARLFATMYHEVAMAGIQKGQSVRPAVDFAVNDLTDFTTYLHAVVLWKWPSLADPDVCPYGPDMVAEALDHALLPSVTDMFTLVQATCLRVDQAILPVARRLVVLPLTTLFQRIGVREYHRLPLGSLSPAMEQLRVVETTLAPSLKATAIAATCREICKCIAAFHIGDVEAGNLAADDLIPMLQLLIVMGCGTEPPWLSSPEAQAVYLDMFLPEHLAFGEAGYCCALFRTAVASILDLGGDGADQDRHVGAAMEGPEEEQVSTEALGIPADGAGDGGRMSVDGGHRPSAGVSRTLSMAKHLVGMMDNLGLHQDD